MMADLYEFTIAPICKHRDTIHETNGKRKLRALLKYGWEGKHQEGPHGVAPRLDYEHVLHEPGWEYAYFKLSRRVNRVVNSAGT
jgi:hypothetical protein